MGEGSEGRCKRRGQAREGTGRGGAGQGELLLQVAETQSRKDRATAARCIANCRRCFCAAVCPLRKYAAPYEHYWRSTNRSDELSHHVDHGVKHHVHHHTARHHHGNDERSRGHGEQPELPAPDYEKYYKQYLPAGVSTDHHHQPAALVDSAGTAPVPASSEALSEASSFGQYMDSSDSFSAKPEIDASSEMSIKFYEPYESMFDKSVTGDQRA